jgi:4-hydroxy-tetrahydrodipicolinate reductase
MVEFTLPDVAAFNLQTALLGGVDCVLGTSGVPTQTLDRLANEAPSGTALFYAPNYTTGAVLMMAASKLAAGFFDDVEIIEFHHNNKKDAPSGTAIATAEMLEAARSAEQIRSSAPGAETELSGFSGARGAELGASGIRLHALRSNGFVASQEVIFGSTGQRLTIRHDSFDRTSYMPGVLLAIRRVGALSGLVIGLEELMQL